MICTPWIANQLSYWNWGHQRYWSSNKSTKGCLYFDKFLPICRLRAPLHISYRYFMRGRQRTHGRIPLLFSFQPFFHESEHWKNVTLEIPVYSCGAAHDRLTQYMHCAYLSTTGFLSVVDKWEQRRCPTTFVKRCLVSWTISARTYPDAHPLKQRRRSCNVRDVNDCCCAVLTSALTVPHFQPSTPSK